MNTFVIYMIVETAEDDAAIVAATDDTDETELASYIRTQLEDGPLELKIKTLNVNLDN